MVESVYKKIPHAKFVSTLCEIQLRIFRCDGISASVPVMLFACSLVCVIFFCLILPAVAIFVACFLIASCLLSFICLCFLLALFVCSLLAFCVRLLAGCLAVAYNFYGLLINAASTLTCTAVTCRLHVTCLICSSVASKWVTWLTSAATLGKITAP